MEAESAPENLGRYFCHTCNTEIDRVSTDFKCPRCLDGFIEELPANSMSVDDGSGGGASNGLSDESLRLANEILTNPMLTPLLMTTSGARPFDAFGGESSSDGGANGGRLGARVLRGGGRGRDFNITNFDTILQDILISVSGGEGAPMFFMGNPGDYAWGREGLDTIVTQLLNQMDNTGPPPLEKEKIDELPTVSIDQSQVDKKLQCSVCWEDFQLNEQVRELPCSHVFHNDCICPWLSNHGTCPICRKSLVAETNSTNPGGPTDQQRTSLSAVLSNTIRNVTAAIRPRGSSTSSSDSPASTSQPAPSSSSSSTSTSSNTSNPAGFFGSLTPNSSTNQTNNSRNNDRMRDDDGNIDFDFD